MLIILMNFYGFIVLAISVVTTAVLYKLFPHAPDGFGFFFVAVPLMVVGYVAELLAMRPRIYYVPIYAIGLGLTICATLAAFGPLYAALIGSFLFLCAVCLWAFNESKAWKLAQKTLLDYEQLGEAEPELHEMMLLNSLFKNRWTRGNQQHIKHNEKVVNYLLHDPAIHLSELEQRVLTHTQEYFTAGERLIKWGWLLNYIGNTQERLMSLRENRSIGRMRV